MASKQTAEFTPTAVHERLDWRGLLDDAHGSGCYALELSVPDCHETAVRQWLAEFDAIPGDDAIERLAESERAAYVGASSDVYDRLMDHARADVRRASVLRAFPATAVLDVEPDPEPFDRERRYALSTAGGGMVVWCDGEVVG